jgi:hypothetical protein
VNKTDHIEQMLNEMPSWSEITGENKALSANLLPYLQNIAGHKTEHIQQAVTRYVEQSEASSSGYNIAAMSRLYVLNRFIFQVPEWIESGKPRFAAFRGIPQKGNLINELWPFSFSASGELSITGIYGGYSGESFQALKEFISFNNLYGRRSY